MPCQNSSLLVRSNRLQQNSNMASAAELARLVTNRAGDFQHLERIKGELGVMTLRVGKSRDTIGNGLINAFTRSN